MKVRIDFGYASGDGGSLAERLGFTGKHMDIEASTIREAFENLRSQRAEAWDLLRLSFNRMGILNGYWIVILNRGSVNAKGIKSEADLDVPLEAGDRIYITSVC